MTLLPQIALPLAPDRRPASQAFPRRADTGGVDRGLASAGTPGPRRVLYFDHTAALGGGELALLALVRRLDLQRYEPVVVLGADGPLAGKLRDAGIQVRILPLDARVASAPRDRLGASGLRSLPACGRTLAYVIRLRRLIVAEQVDLVHTNSLKADLIGGLAARLAGRPVIWHIRDRISSDYLPAPVAGMFRWLSRLIPNFVVANSQSTLRTVGRLTSARVIYSGVEDCSLAAPSGPTGGVVSKDRVSEDRVLDAAPIIGLVGRISPWKGQHVFVRAAAAIVERFPSARFQIVGAPLFGEQDYELQVKELTARLGLEGRIEFTGFRSDVTALMRQFDILVHASTVGEPFGQVVVQGMAAGKPVVATNGGGVPEIVTDGVTGLLVPMGDANALADAVCTLLADPVRAREMGRLGRERVLDRFTIEASVEALQEVYDNIRGRLRRGRLAVA
jgi:glycosyltransferase involved in cell wall biosynthesis